MTFTDTTPGPLRSAVGMARLLGALPVLALLAAPVAQASGVSVITLAFETDALDLDTGEVRTTDLPLDEEAGADIRIAYNALRSPSAVVLPAIADGVDIAFIAGVAFDGVTAATASGLAFSTDPVECVDFTKKAKKGPTESQREKVLGVVITLSLDGKELLKQGYPENFVERMEEEAKRKEAREKEDEKRR